MPKVDEGPMATIWRDGRPKKLRDILSSSELQAHRSLERWCENKETMTAGQVRAAAEQIVNVLGWLLESEVVDKR